MTRVGEKIDRQSIPTCQSSDSLDHLLRNTGTSLLLISTRRKARKRRKWERLQSWMVSMPESMIGEAVSDRPHINKRSFRPIHRLPHHDPPARGCLRPFSSSRRNYSTIEGIGNYCVGRLFRSRAKLDYFSSLVRSPIWDWNNIDSECEISQNDFFKIWNSKISNQIQKFWIWKSVRHFFLALYIFFPSTTRKQDVPFLLLF